MSIIEVVSAVVLGVSLWNYNPLKEDQEYTYTETVQMCETLYPEKVNDRKFISDCVEAYRKK